MNRRTSHEDRSRTGALVHGASAQGRHVYVTAYIEAPGPDGLAIESTILCRTSEQATEIARVLAEHRTSTEGGCEGEGTCHGPMKWCNRCGDVGKVCDSLGGCDVHGEDK